MPGISCVCSTPPCARTIPARSARAPGLPRVRPAHLDPYDLTALRGRHDDRVVHVAAGRDRRVAGGVDARDVRDEMRERGREPLRVDLGLDGRRVHGELHPPGPDQLDRPVDTGGDDRVQHHFRTG
jgi:hypothetical protein